MITRREAVHRITLLLGGVLSTQLTAGLMGQVTNQGPSVPIDESHKKLIAEVADTIIPTTDTPGAKTAGVEEFIIRVLRDCFRKDEQERFYAGLEALDAQSNTTHGKCFADLGALERTELLKKCSINDKPFFKLMKELTVAGYFTSEIGATQALAYLPIPGRFEGDLPMTPDQKTWAL